MRSTYKKPLALLLSAALSFTLSGSPVYASNSSLLPETGTRSALPAQTANLFQCCHAVQRPDSSDSIQHCCQPQPHFPMPWKARIPLFP